MIRTSSPDTSATARPIGAIFVEAAQDRLTRARRPPRPIIGPLCTLIQRASGPRLNVFEQNEPALACGRACLASRTAGR